ncbi:phosphotransferase, partial [Streptomyces sp. NPDC001832]|uniref:phosphotransferase family protein n=1 Tax=Streptomyces sp. NPDC001832 TaxID=3154527 RepID=UPI0033200294
VFVAPRGGGGGGPAAPPPPPAPVPIGQLLRELAAPLAAVHRIQGPHAGRLAGAQHHRTWRDYLHNRLDAYATASPELTHIAAALHQEVDAEDIDIEPRLLHHDLQPGHLVRSPNGLMLLDWELAALGDPLSDPARLTVRLDHADPTDALSLVCHQPPPGAGRRIRLYWRIHQLADAALSTDPVVWHRARARLA